MIVSPFHGNDVEAGQVDLVDDFIEVVACEGHTGFTDRMRARSTNHHPEGALTGIARLNLCREH